MTDEDDLRESLPSLEIVLAAHATDAVPSGSAGAGAASGKHDLTSVTVPAAEDCEIVVVGDHTYVVWKPVLHIPWPRTRLQRPAIYFTANLNLSSNAAPKTAKLEKDYLAPYEPLPANVLEPLNFDPAFRGKQIYLPEDRITKFAPRAPKRDEGVKSVRGASKRAFPTMPALFTRIRYSTVPDGTIASLHIETSRVIAGVFEIQPVSMTVGESSAEIGSKQTTAVAYTYGDCVIESMTNDTSWPMRMRAGDESILLFKLISKAKAPKPTTLSVAIRATAALESGSHIDLDINWQSQAMLQQAILETAYRWSGLLSAFLNDHVHLPTQNGPGPGASKDVVEKDKPATVDGGVTFFFSAPPTARQNEEFQLKIKCINESGQSRRFAVAPVRPKKPHVSKPSKPTVSNADSLAGTFQVPPVERQKRPDVFCDTPDIRIGPLAAGATFETEMNFRVLSTGVLDLGTVRIVDLDTRQAVDVKELPDVIALERIEDGAPYQPRGTVPRRDDEVSKQMEAASQQWRKGTAEWIAQRSGLQAN